MLIAMAAGCGAADSTDTERAPLRPTEKPDQPIAAEKAADSGCPLALPGAQVSSEVTSDGVALVFSIAGGDPADLRDRVHKMADRHNATQAPAEDAGKKAKQEGGMTSPEGAHGMDMHGAARQVPSRAVVEDTKSGARIVFTPSDPAKVGALREQIRVHGREMATTGCVAEQPAPRAAPPAGESRPVPEPPPTPAPNPEEPVLPDRPVTPDQPITPPVPPPPPTGGQPFVQ